MRCPKCGFVSFPGLDECKKCGHRFTPVRNQQPGIPPLFRQPSTETAQPAAPGSEQPAENEQVAGHEDGNWDDFSEPGAAFLDPREQSATDAGASGPAPSMDWQKELSERMQEFRRRRARISMGKEEDDENNLNLDFEPPASGPGKSAASPNVVELPSFDELDLREDASTGLRQDWDSLGKEKVPAKADRRGALSTGARQVRIQPPPTDPMEIELDSSPASAGLIGSRGDASALKVASLSKRFLAGFFDFLVLLSAGGVFALIFWRAGGRLPLLPLNLVVAALIGVIFLMAYFGVFTVLASGTPGLIWAGLEVRTFEGNAPKQIDCFWRSFGYLVSVSAFMLGFIWSLVDSEGLTWHDRMSRTLLVDTRDQEALQAATEVSP